MKLSLDIKTSLNQTLTPQQIQYLKLLQLPVMQMEQQIKQEIDENPMLEEIGDDFEDESSPEEYQEEADDFEKDGDDYEDTRDMIDDEKDPFEFYNMVWQDDSEFKPASKKSPDEEDNEESYPIRAQDSFTEDLINQLKLIPMKQEEYLLGEQIIGNIDDDGYLRRDLQEIVDETNSIIAELNFRVQKHKYDMEQEEKENLKYQNPAKQFALSDRSRDMLTEAENISHGQINEAGLNKNGDPDIKILDHISLDDAEKVLNHIQSLDPPGIASRNIQECLLAQINVLREPSDNAKNAKAILTKTYDAFIKKHYQVIKRQIGIDDEQLRKAFEFIRTLNPKPGGSEFTHEHNTVIPDFTVEREKETDELVISVNDSRMPKVQLNKAYEKLRKEARLKKFNKESRKWIRNKHEDAKFLIQAIRQRRNTMLKVMTAIAHLQRDFFDVGRSGLKPLIYKNVAEQTGLDISTVCRIVNGKYVQTDFGTFELKFFFSESLPNLDGEEISTTIIKEKLREIIDSENKHKPLSDEKISKLLKEEGFNVARRTVAKYREQLKIPVARLRKEL